MRMREQANQNVLRQPNMLMQNQMANMRRNGLQNMNLQKTALQNNTLYVLPWVKHFGLK
jgi:hypothetical protein